MEYYMVHPVPVSVPMTVVPYFEGGVAAMMPVFPYYSSAILVPVMPLTFPMGYYPVTFSPPENFNIPLEDGFRSISHHHHGNVRIEEEGVQVDDTLILDADL